MDVRRDAESTRSEGVFTEVVFFLGTEDMPSSTDLFIGSHIYRIFILRRMFGLLNGTF